MDMKREEYGKRKGGKVREDTKEKRKEGEKRRKGKYEKGK